MINKKHKKVFTAFNYIEHLLILASAVTGCVSIFDFASLICLLASLIPIGIASSAVGVKINPITAGIKKYKSIAKKKRKRHNQMVLLAKTKLNSIEV